MYKLLKQSIFIFIAAAVFLTGANSAYSSSHDVSFSFQSSNPNPSQGEQFQIEVFVSPSQPASVITLQLSYDPQSLEILSTTKSGNPPFDNWTFTPAIDSVNGKYTVATNDTPPSPGSFNSATAVSTNTKLITLNVKLIGSSATITTDTSNSNAGVFTTGTPAILTAQTSSLTISTSATGNSTPAPKYTPSEQCDACGKCMGDPQPPEDYNQCKACIDQDGKQWTVVGCVETTAGGFVQNSLKILFSVAGGIAFLALLYGGGILLTASGKAEQIQQGKGIITKAIVGLLLVIFSVYILRFLGVTIFNLPGFN